MDRYTKIILTVIAVLLALHLVKPYVLPMNADAINRVQDVNIANVGGGLVTIPAGIPVYVTTGR
jgi:hypothetical protein